MMPSSTDSDARRRRIAQSASGGRRNNGGSEQSGRASSSYNNVSGSSYSQYPVANYTPAASSTMNGQSSIYGGDNGSRRDMRQAADGPEVVYIVDESPVAGLPYQESSGSDNRYWGGDTNPGLTTSYDRYEGGAMGDLYYVPAAPQSMPRTSRYQERDLGYSPRAREYRLPPMQRDDRRRDSLMRDATWPEQNGSASASEFSAGTSSSRRQGLASQYTADSEYYVAHRPRQPRRDFQGETYINGNVESRYARTQPSRRRRRDSSDSE